jgi:hypothetical protein
VRFFICHREKQRRRSDPARKEIAATAYAVSQRQCRIASGFGSPQRRNEYFSGAYVYESIGKAVLYVNEIIGNISWKKMRS